MKFWENYEKGVSGYQGLEIFLGTFKRVFMKIWENVDT